MQFTIKETLECPGCGAARLSYERLRSYDYGSQTVVRQRCSICSLLFFDPAPIPGNYDMDPVEYWDKSLFKGNRFVSVLKTLRGLVQLRTDTKALDVGAGVGMDMLDMQHAGFEVYGCEPSVQFCRWAVNENHIPRDRLKADPIEDVVYGAAFFDFISFNKVMEHVSDPKLALEKAFLWLRPGGIIYVNCRTKLRSSWLDSLKRFVGVKKEPDENPLLPPYYLYTFGSSSLMRIAEAAGFRVLETIEERDRSVIWLRKT